MTDDMNELKAILRVFALASYRDLVSTCQAQRWKVALWLHRSGVKSSTVQHLWDWCQDKGRSPEGLFASSFDRPSTLSKRLKLVQQWVRDQADTKTDDVVAPVFNMDQHRRSM